MSFGRSTTVMRCMLPASSTVQTKTPDDEKQHEGNAVTGGCALQQAEADQQQAEEDQEDRQRARVLGQRDRDCREERHCDQERRERVAEHAPGPTEGRARQGCGRAAPALPAVGRDEEEDGYDRDARRRERQVARGDPHLRDDALEVGADVGGDARHVAHGEEHADRGGGEQQRAAQRRAPAQGRAQHLARVARFGEVHGGAMAADVEGEERGEQQREGSERGLAQRDGRSLRLAQVLGQRPVEVADLIGQHEQADGQQQQRPRACATRGAPRRTRPCGGGELRHPSGTSLSGRRIAPTAPTPAPARPALKST